MKLNTPLDMDIENRMWLRQWPDGSKMSSEKVFCPTGPGGGIDPTCSPGGGLSATRIGANGIRTLANGDPLPEHIPYIAPAWTDVVVNTDPKGDLLVKGRDEAGRVQSLYSDSYEMRQAKIKFAKVSELRKKEKEVRKEIIEDLAAPDPKEREAAAAALLIQHTGIRPGSNKDTKAKKQAYGATTLLGRHVVTDGKKVELQYTGKAGKDLRIPIRDRKVAEVLMAKRASLGDDDKVFNVSDKQLREYTSGLDGGGFTPKDFRTARGTSTAVRAMGRLPAPKTQKEYQQAVKAVAKEVATVLGNTPAVALESYIDPTIFSEWRLR